MDRTKLDPDIIGHELHDGWVIKGPGSRFHGACDKGLGQLARILHEGNEAQGKYGKQG